MEVLRRLDAEALAPATLTVREPTLDDVFLALTGKHCYDCEDDEAASAADRRRATDRPRAQSERGAAAERAAA